MQTDNTIKLSRRSQELLDRVIGKKFGRLTIQKLYGKDEHSKLLGLCDCDCGTKDIVLPIKVMLTGNTMSCGCYRRDRLRELKSGLASKHPAEYQVFCGMKSRCYNRNELAYIRYGGRGIIICKEWRNPKTGFATFLNDMGPRPSLEHSIERKDNDGPYAPWNCIWATEIEQQRNKSTNHLLRFGNESKCVTAWEEQLGFKPGTLKKRLRDGWDVDRALTTPVGSSRKSTRWLTFNGETHSVSEWERMRGWKQSTLSARLKHGWTVDEALSIPLGEDRPGDAERRLKRSRHASDVHLRNTKRKREEKLQQLSLGSVATAGA